MGPAASDGPAFETVTVATPDVPGARAGVDEATERSASPGPTGTLAATELSVVFGSSVVETAEAEPPVKVVKGNAFAGNASGTAMCTEAPFAIGANKVQVMGPAGSVPVQPAGSEVMLTPLGGEYVMVMAPSASDGPLSRTVMVAVPDVPGVIAGVATVVCRSAEPIWVATVEGPLLLTGAGSETFADVTVAKPFLNGSVGGADDGTDSTMSTVA
jgi:hypothetical protein